VKKGYILEVKGEYLLVMTEEQRFLRLQKKQGVNVGDEILFSENQVLDITRSNNRKENFMKKIKHAKPMGIAAAMVMFLVLSIFAISGGESEAQYLLSFDVNPGVQIEVGEDYKVLAVHAANEEAKELGLEDLKGESLEDFLGEFLDKLSEKGYLNNETAQVLFSYADLLEDEEASEDFAEQVTEQMEAYFTERNMNVEINMLRADSQNYENARLEGITLGKFQLIRAIEEQEGRDIELEDEEATEEEAQEPSEDPTAYRDMEVRELLEHPVFERHPRDRKAEGLHPVFDVHPRDWSEEDGEKPHPVFDKHPGNRGNDDNDDETLNEEGRDEDKEHPVFDEHPRNRDKEDGEHPVFDEHPRNRGNSHEQESDDSEDGEEGNSDDDEKSNEAQGSDEEREHPVFKNHPGNRGNGNS